MDCYRLHTETSLHLLENLIERILYDHFSGSSGDHKIGLNILLQLMISQHIQCAKGLTIKRNLPDASLRFRRRDNLLAAFLTSSIFTTIFYTRSILRDGNRLSIEVHFIPGKGQCLPAIRTYAGA